MAFSGQPHPFCPECLQELSSAHSYSWHTSMTCLHSKVTSKARLFADCLLYSTITTEDDASHLQMDLENLQRWETDWLVHFNHNNCEVIRITTKGRQRLTPTTFKGQGFAIITQVKYLGVNISNKSHQ